MSTDQERMDDGLRIRKEILDADRVDQTMASATDFNREWQEYVNRACWGETWARTAIDRKTRSLLTVAMLATMGRSQELRTHLNAALGNGATPEELQDTLFHVSVYAGVPAAFDAFRIANEVING